MGLYIYRLEGAALLDASMYEGIESNRAVTLQAAATVLLSSLATGLGATAWFGWHPLTILTVSGVALLTWVAWASLMFQIGSRFLPEPATRTDLGELLRTTGFAAAPGLLQVLAVLPAIAAPVFILTAAWMFVAMVTAVKHALDYRSTARALAVCALGALLCLSMAAVFALVFSQSAS
jgi:Yip1 domain